jgi:hypothetical protein
MQGNKKTIAWRSESHSDISDSAPFRRHVVAKTETAFACALLKELRERGGTAGITELHEEWLSSGDGGRVYEIRAEVADLS